MPNFTGQLNTNKIIGALFNQIISIRTFSDNIGEMYSSLVDRARVDGSMYGDTKLYTSLDIRGSKPWGNDAEATNLLQLNRPRAPKTQAIKIDVFRQAFITIDNYLTKQAFAGEGSFSEFNSVVLSTLRDAKRIYDTTTYNTFIGTAKSAVQAPQDITIDPAQSPSVAQGAAVALSKLLTRLKDNSRDYNDYGFMRAYDPSRIQVIWNADYVSDIKKNDLPAIFHEEGLMEKFDEKNALPARFFGDLKAAGGTADGTSIRTMVEMEIGDKDYFPGDLLPKGTAYKANEAYVANPKVIAIVTTPDVVPFMSAFEVQTNFFNPKSLTENDYLTWGHNTLERLLDRPFVHIYEKA